jgi:hypothetical protein
METNQQVPAPDDNTNAIPGLVSVSILFVVSSMAYGVRIYSRVRPAVRLAVPDYVITMAVVSATSTRFLWTMLTSMTAMRVNRLYQYDDGHTFRFRTLQLLSFTT